MNSLPVYILAGGKSSRFGRDKARALLQDQPLINRVADMLQPVADPLSVVAQKDGDYEDMGLRTIGDAWRGYGPLAGLDTALRDLPAEQDWLLLVSCDLVMVRLSWIIRLMTQRHRDIDAVVFKTPAAVARADDRHVRWHPMPGLYHRNCLPQIRNSLSEGRRSLHDLLQGVRTVALPQPTDWPVCWQINTPEELAAAQQQLGAM